MAEGSYNQYCPVAMAAELLCARWTMLVVRELMLGSTRFNELRRGLPRMSPALLSKRLKELEKAGIVARSPTAAERGIFEYTLTPAGIELKPVVEIIGVWGHRWLSTELTLKNLDPNLLMWDIRRNIDTDPMPKKRSVVQFIFKDLQPQCRNWWLIVVPNEDVDLCSVDPGFDVDLYLVSDLRTMTEIWMGYRSIANAKSQETLIVTGSKDLESSLLSWLSLSRYAKIEKVVA